MTNTMTIIGSPHFQFPYSVFCVLYQLECDVILEAANRIDPSKLSYWDQKDLKILKLSLETFIEGYQWKR